jgi:chromosome partitioning protein
MLICFASEKGGAGKTTLAALLAEGLHARGIPFQLADGDRQSSLAALAERSEGRLPPTRQVFPTQFRRLCDAELTLLDLPSGIGVEFNTAMALADVAIVPAVPSAFDLRTLPATLTQIRRAQELRQGLPRALIVPNKIDLREVLSKELLDVVAKLGWPVTRTWLNSRSAYRRLGSAGLGALPRSVRRAAEAERDALMGEVLAFLGLEGAALAAAEEAA